MVGLGKGGGKGWRGEVVGSLVFERERQDAKAIFEEISAGKIK
jgi:hypothetical protein